MRCISMTTNSQIYRCANHLVMLGPGQQLDEAAHPCAAPQQIQLPRSAYRELTRSCWGLASSSLKQRALKTIRWADPPGRMQPWPGSFMAAAGVLHTLLGHCA